MMRGLAFVALAFAGLLAFNAMPTTAAAPGKPGRAAGYVDTCYEKTHATIARWAIDYMCADVTKGSTETWLMELPTPDSPCAKGKATVTIVSGEPVATTSKGVVCKTINHRVAVDSHMCATLATGRNNICRGYIDDRAKAAKSHNILTVREIPEPKLSATVRFQVRLKAKCRSLANPKYLGWFAKGQVLEGRPCSGSNYLGDSTWETPKNPWDIVPPPPPKVPAGPNGNGSPFPGRSPSDDGPEDDIGDDNPTP